MSTGATRPDLDHVAIATTDIAEMFGALVGDLGGTVFFGGDGHGFRWVQTRVGTATTGMTIESLVVWQPEVDDFLARFVARHGGGAHHVTFKVPDIEATIDACRARGITPVGIRLDDPQWREAFLLPRDAHGTVVQLAQTTDTWDLTTALPEAASTGATGNPRWWPEPPAPTSGPVALDHVVVGAPDRDATTGFFVELLGGEVVTTDASGNVLRWPGRGRIRVEDAARAGVLRFDATRAVRAAPPRVVDVSGVAVHVH